ncbi:MAG: hypothetical protein Q8922_07360 [Bacteroidota bacterium]|nr:hypothetical protein [Bacteroidota bacterium]MDP4243672.1 hypothetical protein [Bacteroidota bacterium]MDP4287739.1 hypothetical protein [Bacteroidota bacterium]
MSIWDNLKWRGGEDDPDFWDRVDAGRELAPEVDAQEHNLHDEVHSMDRELAVARAMYGLSRTRDGVMWEKLQQMQMLLEEKKEQLRETQRKLALIGDGTETA